MGTFTEKFTATFGGEFQPPPPDVPPIDVRLLDVDGSNQQILPGGDATSGYLSLQWSTWGWQPNTCEVVLDARLVGTVGAPEGRLVVVEDVVLRVDKVIITQDTQEPSRAPYVARLLGVEPATADPPRRVLPPSGQDHDSFTGPAESAMKHYVAASCGTSAAAGRQLAAFTVAADTAAGEEVSVDGRYQLLRDVLADVGKIGGVGHTCRYEDGVVFDVLSGTDRTNELVLDVDMGTVYAEEILSDASESTNKAYVGGQGEGAARKIVQTHLGANEPQGWERRETWVDGRDTNSTSALRSRGRAELSDPPEAVEVQVNQTGAQYGTDYAVMDQLRYRNAYGADRVVRVVGVTQSVSGGSAVPEVTVHLDRPWPDVDIADSALSGAQIV